MKKLLSVLSVLIFSLTSFSLLAYAWRAGDTDQIRVDGFCYEIEGDKACLYNLEYGTEPENGVLNVPSTFEYEGKTYTVVSLSTERSLDEYEDGVYNYCGNIQAGTSKIILPDTVTEINLEAFGTKEKPVEVVLSKSVETIIKDRHSHKKTSTQNLYEYITFDLSQNEHFTIENNLLIKDGKKIIAAMGGYDSYEIPERFDIMTGFKHCERITSITVPSRITEIASRAFFGCSLLQEIKFEERQTPIKIGDYAFGDCSMIKELTVPEWLSEDSNNPFAGLPELQKATFHENYKSTKIPTGIFSYCPKLVTIEIPDNITHIGSYAFSGCAAVGIDLPQGLTSLEQCVFADCKNLKQITIPERVTVLNNSCFENCTSLTKIIIPPNVTHIKNGAFENCFNLESVQFSGDKLQRIQTRAFAFCKALRQIDIPKGAKVADGAFVGSGLDTDETEPANGKAAENAQTVTSPSSGKNEKPTSSAGLAEGDTKPDSPDQKEETSQNEVGATQQIKHQEKETLKETEKTASNAVGETENDDPETLTVVLTVLAAILVLGGVAAAFIIYRKKHSTAKQH